MTPADVRCEHNRPVWMAALLVLGIWSSVPSLATEPGFYAGLNFGQSKFNSNRDWQRLNTVTPADGVRTWTNQSDTAWAIEVGYRVNSYVGVEASYNDFGRAAFDESRSSSGRNLGTTTIQTNETISASGTAITLVGSIPLHNWEFLARLGILFARTESSGTVRTAYERPFQTIPPTPPVISFSSLSEPKSSSDAMFGLGVGYSFADHYHIKLGWMLVSEVGDEDEFGGVDLSELSAGFQYRF